MSVYNRCTQALVKALPLLFFATGSLVCSASQAATVDGQPSYNLKTDSGLYVWRTGGKFWHVRLVSGRAPRQFHGEFKASEPFDWVKLVEMESADSATRPVPDQLNIAYEAWPGGADGTDFAVAQGAGLCLRNAGGPPTVVYLGQKAVPASTPVDLSGSGACSGSTASGDGLFISRASDGRWQVRLSSDSKRQQFNGVFEAARNFQHVDEFSLESGDSAILSAANMLNTTFSTWPGGKDGIDFAVIGNGGVCLRDNGGSDAQVYLGADADNAVPVTMPVDLTGSGACSGLPVVLPPPQPPPSGGRKFNSGHYVALLRGVDSTSVMSNSIQAGVKGFMKRYTWRELEPALGQYDFSEVASDLAFVSGQGMHLIVMIEDKTFTNERPTPSYLDDSQYTRANISGGYTAVRWSPYVVTRMKAVVKALGQRFDGNPSFEGVAIQESAPSMAESALSASAYTPEKYRDALIDVLTDATRSMPTSRVFWMMNFLPKQQSYIGNIASTVAPLGVVMGGPDVMPDSYALQERTYPFYSQFRGKMPLFGQVEPSCYSHMHADTSYPTMYWTMPELFRYARDTLKVNYMFWVRLPNASPSNSYDWYDALPVIANNPELNP